MGDGISQYNICIYVKFCIKTPTSLLKQNGLKEDGDSDLQKV